MNLRGRSYAWQGERCQRYGVRGWSRVEVRQRKQQESRNKRRAGRYAGRARLAVAPDRSAQLLGGPQCRMGTSNNKNSAV